MIPTTEPPKNPFLERERALPKKRLTYRREARKAVERAIERGELVPQRCELGFEGCEEWPTEAHHRSYHPKHWLNVVWVCRSCHASV